MVDRYFHKAIEEQGIQDKTLKLIKRETARVLKIVLNNLKEDLLSKRKKPSKRSNSHNNFETEFTEDLHNESITQLLSNKDFVIKLARERLERERKRLEREEKMKIKEIEEKEEQEMRKRQEIFIKEEEKQRRIEDLLRKKEERQKNLEKLKEIGDKELKEVANSKPLYVKIEENYEELVLMPELEKKKADLARKREMFQPIKRSEIIEHMRKYQETAIESQMKREINFKTKQIEFKYNNSTFFLKSRFTDNVLEEERKKKEELEKLESGKKDLLQKKKKYAAVVKEMFAPSIDEFKRQEMLLIKEKLKHPVRIKLSENRSNSEEEENGRKKWKKNPLVPEPMPKREGKVFDYLAEKRKQRINSVDVHAFHVDWESIAYDASIETEEKIEKLKKKAKQLEKNAEKFERNIKSVTSADKQAMIIDHEADALILNSIKAKLAILNHNLN